MRSDQAVRYLIDVGGMPVETPTSEPDSSQLTPLICAAQSGHVETMHVLLELGANIENRGKGRTGDDSAPKLSNGSGVSLGNKSDQIVRNTVG